MGTSRTIITQKDRNDEGTFGRESAPRHYRRNPLYFKNRRCLAHDAQRFAPLKNVLSSLSVVVETRLLETNPRCDSRSGTSGSWKKSSTAAILDSQSVRTASQPGLRGFDAGKKITGRKRHILVDTLGFILGLEVTPADKQDRDGARSLLRDTLSTGFGWQTDLGRRRILGAIGQGGVLDSSTQKRETRDREKIG